MNTNLNRLPLALFFSIIIIISGITFSQESYLSPVIYFGSLFLAAIFAIYGMVEAKKNKRSKILLTTDIAALAVVVYYGWLLLAIFETFNHWPTF